MTPLIEAHLRWLGAAGRAEATIIKRRRLLLDMDKELRAIQRKREVPPLGLDGASEDEIVTFFGQYNVPWTLYTYDGHARGYYAWAVMRDHLTIDPMALIPKPRQGDSTPHPCTDEELAVALSGPELYARAIELASQLGLRCGEIARARGEHVSDRRLRVRGKGRKVRVVPIPAHLHLPARGPLLGRDITPGRLSRNQREVWRRLGLPDRTRDEPGFSLHSGRHWYATRLIENGVDLVTVSELLGHSTVATTQNYTRVTNARLAWAVNQLPRIEPGSASIRPGLFSAA